MIIRVCYEFDLSLYEEWCHTKFTDEEKKRIKYWLESHDDKIAYDLRDYINLYLREEE